MITCFVADLRLEIYNTSTDTVAKYIWKLQGFFCLILRQIFLWYT